MTLKELSVKKNLRNSGQKHCFWYSKLRISRPGLIACMRKATTCIINTNKGYVIMRLSIRDGVYSFY